MVSKSLMVAGETEQVADAERIRAEQVRLHRQPVAVAADHLDNRLQPLLHQDRSCADAGHAHDGGLIIGQVDRVAVAFEQRGLFDDDIPVRTLRRAEFSGDGEVPILEDAFQIRT